MVQYPVNVYPDNVTLDTSYAGNDRDIHYTFKGDILKAYIVRIYDYNTGEVAVNDTPIYDYDHVNLVFRKLAFNDDTVTCAGLLPNITNNGNYVMQMMLIEGTNSGSGVQTNRFVLRGSLQEDHVAGDTTMVIEDKINTIYEWDLNVTNIREPYKVTEGEVEYSLNVMRIKIGNKLGLIKSYNYETGEITVAPIDGQPFGELDKGTSYQIYCNYLITNVYYFNVANRPQITNLYATFDAFGIHVSAAYSQLQNLPLKYFNIELQKKSSSDVYHTIAKTKDIYSVDIRYDFVDDYDYYDMGGNDETRKYRFIVNTVSQEGVVVTATSNDFIAPARSSTEVISNTSVSANKGTNEIFVQWTETGIMRSYRLYRIDADENYGIKPYKVLLADLTSTTGFHDITASTNKNYKYMIVPYSSNIGSTEIDTAVMTAAINMKQYGYSITAIKDSGKDADGKPFYFMGDTWKFIGEIDDVTVTQNTDKSLHVGYGKYSAVTSTNVNYASGTLSALIGQMYCPTFKFRDDIKLVEAWREFITQDCQFILRSQKGDVWMVNITDNPTTEYQENIKQLPTRINFSWAECGNVEDILLGQSLPPKYHDRW